MQGKGSGEWGEASSCRQQHHDVSCHHPPPLRGAVRFVSHTKIPAPFGSYVPFWGGTVVSKVHVPLQVAVQAATTHRWPGEPPNVMGELVPPNGASLVGGGATEIPHPLHRGTDSLGLDTNYPPPPPRPTNPGGGA